ncbi:coatomer subunit beta' isoform X1 [Leguminivora glycinivorella]|uniref:coatomer subunit beta' isoform X1 n=1 Tax=Leguminivora glycinivorella TaxID=1035111 RepID=UPI00200FBFC2|nr:coatomer subunit beta' isoform X1 [Leguminivora glycinivorella]
MFLKPLRLDIKRKLTARSDRVKCVDQHPTEPWLLCSLYNGDVNIWNYETQLQIKRFEVCMDLPVRSAKFVPRKNWVVTGSDDMQIRVFNYNTLERIHSFEAHSDYVRCIAIHPTQPYILTCSDDLLIKLWNWDRNWACQQVFEGHTHYVMQIVINPKDNNTFASASLDTTVKVWQLGSSVSNFTLEGHEKGVNCVDYYHGGDKPYLISGADDRLVKIWDYQNKTCVQTLEGHAQNVSAVSFHPELPILLTGSEDGTVRIWHAGTYRLESSLNYGFERVWTISSMHASNNVAIGYDEGTIMIKVGREEPAISMDVNGGKIIWAKHSEMQQVNLKALPEGTEMKDGERVPVVAKDMGSCEIYPQTIAHNPNGRFVVVCGDGEYIIYTAMALRNKAFGTAQEFVWAFDSSEYATLENSSTIKVFKNFKERKSFKPEYGAEGIFGGYMLGVKSISGMAFSFYDWEHLELIRRIEIQPRHVYWSESGSLVCLATDETYYVLRLNAAVVTRARASNTGITDDGIEDAFEVVGDVNETVKTGLWVGDCFIYTNSLNRLNYYVGGEIVTISHLDHTMYILGYVAKENRLYLNDKELNVVSYSLLLSVLEYQTAVMRGDFETADRVLPTVPHDHRTRVAHFLEKQGFKQQALAVSTEPEHQFELALALGELGRARALAEEAAAAEGAPSRTAAARWARLGAAAAAHADQELTKTCYQKAQDYSALLLFAASTADEALLEEVATLSAANGDDNIAFAANFTLNRLDACLQLLIARRRLPEAAFFARSYIPSKMVEVVKLWRESVGATNKRSGQSLADPENYENLFPEFAESLELERYQNEFGFSDSSQLASYPSNWKQCNIDRDLAAEKAAAEQAGRWKRPERAAPPPDDDKLAKAAQGPSTDSIVTKPTDSTSNHKDPLDIMDEIDKEIDGIALEDDEALELSSDESSFLRFDSSD